MTQSSSVDALASTTRPPRVIIIGAGMSGLCMGVKLREAGNDNFRIYEKAARVGGTWRENTYPNGDPIAYPFSLTRFTRDMRAPMLDEFVVA